MVSCNNQVVEMWVNGSRLKVSYEYANEFGKQGRKNPRYIPKITINRELFSRDIEKNIYIYAQAQSSGILRQTPFTIRKPKNLTNLCLT